jgi:hypothetical protein
MTRERAKELRDLCWTNMQGREIPTLTPTEHTEILTFWKTMAGHTCYYDALARMTEELP